MVMAGFCHLDVGYELGRAAPSVAGGQWRLLDGVMRRYIRGNRNLGSEFGFG